ncbi:hypothetical protein WR25_23094 [Diploscapter pachys]|uniref:Abnormal cell migration protein 18-like fibronectin type I domain-containing protein n=1 Tax=Diploscapter pachys TaxID=2018661 RepID=A0A2A2LKW0_9BILA|nr:hypothetical protein WR25_23094 [Diploscapter pachys]
MKFCILAALVSLVSACTYQGKTYKNGESWISQSAFKIKCTVESNGSWKTDVIACLTPKGQKEVPVNAGPVSEGQSDFECVKNENGQVVLKESRGRLADCINGKKQGETWMDKSFKFRCDEGGQTKFIACVTADGSEIPASGSAMISGFEVECRQHANGTISMGASSKMKELDCKTESGQAKKQGEEWVDKAFVHRCGEYGQTKVIGCRPSNYEGTIELNQNATQGELTHICVKDGSSYSFKTVQTKA